MSTCVWPSTRTCVSYKQSCSLGEYHPSLGIYQLLVHRFHNILPVYVIAGVGLCLCIDNFSSLFRVTAVLAGLLLQLVP